MLETVFKRWGIRYREIQNIEIPVYFLDGNNLLNLGSWTRHCFFRDVGGSSISASISGGSVL